MELLLGRQVWSRLRGEGRGERGEGREGGRGGGGDHTAPLTAGHKDGSLNSVFLGTASDEGISLVGSCIKNIQA